MLLGRPFLVNQIDDDSPTGKFQCGLNRVCESTDDVFLRNQSVNNYRDVVLESLLQRFGICKLNNFSVDDRASVTLTY